MWPAGAGLSVSLVTKSWAVDATRSIAEHHAITLHVGGVALPGDLSLPPTPRGVVVFAHGSGSSRLSPRNVEVAHTLVRAEFATLLFDLLTDREALDRRNVFDIPLLASRLAGATGWLRTHPETEQLPLGYFGASTGAAAALWTAVEIAGVVRAVVSRGGRPDLAAPRLARVRAPTLLIVGGADSTVLALNRAALAELGAREHSLAVVPGATHLFEEPGALAQVAELAREWFATYLSAPPRT
jgi:pimeloyl-ACP methyl ester carboxylesterase